MNGRSDVAALIALAVYVAAVGIGLAVILLLAPADLAGAFVGEWLAFAGLGGIGAITLRSTRRTEHRVTDLADVDIEAMVRRAVANEVRRLIAETPARSAPGPSSKGRR